MLTANLQAVITHLWTELLTTVCARRRPPQIVELFAGLGLHRPHKLLEWSSRTAHSLAGAIAMKSVHRSAWTPALALELFEATTGQLEGAYASGEGLMALVHEMALVDEMSCVEMDTLAGLPLPLYAQDLDEQVDFLFGCYCNWMVEGLNEDTAGHLGAALSLLGCSMEVVFKCLRRVRKEEVEMDVERETDRWSRWNGNYEPSDESTGCAASLLESWALEAKFPESYTREASDEIWSALSAFRDSEFHDKSYWDTALVQLKFAWIRRVTEMSDVADDVKLEQIKQLCW